MIPVGTAFAACWIVYRHDLAALIRARLKDRW